MTDKAITETATLSNGERLYDLVRHQRAALHEEGLISDDEFVALVERPGAVDRLQSYDDMRRQLGEFAREDAALREALKTAEERIKEVEAYGREYIERTDPLIACDAAAVELTEGRCGDCRCCLLDQIAELEQQVATLSAGLRAAVACMKPEHRDTPEETATIRKALELLPKTEAV